MYKNKFIVGTTLLLGVIVPTIILSSCSALPVKYSFDETTSSNVVVNKNDITFNVGDGDAILGSKTAKKNFKIDGNIDGKYSEYSMYFLTSNQVFCIKELSAQLDRLNEFLFIKNHLLYLDNTIGEKDSKGFFTSIQYSISPYFTNISQTSNKVDLYACFVKYGYTKTDVSRDSYKNISFAIEKQQKYTVSINEGASI